jgi:hypothetical protein
VRKATKHAVLPPYGDEGEDRGKPTVTHLLIDAPPRAPRATFAPARLRARLSILTLDHFLVVWFLQSSLWVKLERNGCFALGLTPPSGSIKMVHLLLPPLLGLVSFLVINVGGFLAMASGHIKERSRDR